MTNVLDDLILPLLLEAPGLRGHEAVSDTVIECG